MEAHLCDLKSLCQHPNLMDLLADRHLCVLRPFLELREEALEVFHLLFICLALHTLSKAQPFRLEH